MDKQKELDYIMMNEESAKDFIRKILYISDKDRIYYTNYKNLYSINNIIYIYFNVGYKKKAGIYDAIKYYYEYSSKNNNNAYNKLIIFDSCFGYK